MLTNVIISIWTVHHIICVKYKLQANKSSCPTEQLKSADSNPAVQPSSETDIASDDA